ncbi:MAG: N-acetylmuramoyl-L-alanine amidase [Alphaproteobacteria bacterium]
MRKILIISLVYLLNVSICLAANFITEIKLLEKKEETDIVIKSNNNLDYKIFKLDNPKRIVIDFNKTKLQTKLTRIHSSLIKDLRGGIRNGYDLRIVLDLIDDEKPVNLTEYNRKNNDKHELIIALTKRKKEFISETNQTGIKTKLNQPTLGIIDTNYTLINSGLNQDTSKKVVQKDKKPINGRKPVIVIDAGHGGEDPGTIGRFTNIYEKDITLKYARTLANILEKKKLYKVVLTRNKDKFLSLASRVAKAQAEKADLFISLHADSHADPNMKGMSVYTLSENIEDKNNKNIENKLNLASSKFDNSDLKEILNDLVERKRKNISAEFANSLISELNKEVTIVKNSHRFAGFKVLKNDEVPAVLIELGYLSNKSEEKLIMSEKYKIKIINALIQAIDKHFKL